MKNRRSFFSLFGKLIGVAACMPLGKLFALPKPISYWAGTTIPRTVAWENLPLKTKLHVLENSGTTIDVKAMVGQWMDMSGWQQENHIIRPIKNN
jgi:hypothetical protein